ncbi:amino acid adenylation domain-containing protein [Streptomyces sp. NPDC088760]|uniref:amino acid adenylation domain-containing protein n=1 Tax=Streptomyces sp. NPDC088760 TaxID=3365890 RepID=UPI0038289696
MAITDRAQGSLSPAKLALLAKLRGERTGPAPTPRPTLPRRSDPGTAPATHAQQSLWFLDQYLGDEAAATYNLGSALRMRGDLDVELLGECLTVLVARHEALRTTFGTVDGRLVQRFSAPGPVAMPVRDADPARPEEAVVAALREPFDLAAGPLLRPVLFRLGPHDHILLLTVHHIVCDGVSVQILLRELAEVYTARRAGDREDLPPLTVGFGDWAAWTREPGPESEVRDRLAYWKQRLADAPPLLELPTDRPRPAVRSCFDGAETATVVGPSATAALRALCREEGATLFTVLLAAYQVLLARHSGQRDICVGVPVAGRSRPETRDMVGLFVNTVVARGRVDSALTFRGLVRAARQTMAEAYDHQDVPFDQVTAALCPDRTAAHNPLFQAYLDVTPAREPVPAAAGTDWQEFPLPSPYAKFDLSLGVTVREDELEALFDYRTDLFDPGSVERLAARFVRLLGDLAAQPDRPLADLPPLPEDELRQVLAAGTGETVRIDDAALGPALTAQAARTPDAVAVRYGGAELTYRELDARASRLARLLIAQGAGPGRVVAVDVPRSLELIVALGAIARCGAAYLPLDRDHPADRLRFMLEEAGPVCLLTTGRSPCPRPDTLPRVALDDPALEQRLAALLDGPLRDDELPSPRHPLDPAYVLYTSGSTGRPKGVLVPQRGILNRLRWMQSAYPLTAADRVLQKTPSSFDVSVWEFFWPLLEGATLVVARPDGHRDPAYLAELVQREGVTTLHFVPSMLDVFLREPTASGCRSLTRVLCSGEALPGSLADRFHEALPHVELHNLYGPTEASVDVTSWPCPAGGSGADIPIGRPVWNTAARVLDDGFQPVPPGSPGELCLSGDQLALGYLGRPGLTAERFVPDPWGPPGSRMYRTGDLARVRGDGALMFLGRADHQVKIRGLRIELGEIEAVLAGHPAVARVVATVRTDRPGEQRLTAYVTGADGALPIPEELRERAAAALPAYMVPADVVVLDRFPTTVSGKIDRAALPAPVAPRRDAAERPATDREALLCALYADLLGLEDAGPLDDFFALGGDSIGSIHLVSRARRAGVLLTPRQVFEHRTPRALAQVAAVTGAGDGGAAEDDGTGTVPLTPIMRWWRAQGGPTAGFHQSLLVSTPRGMTARQLTDILQALLDRHDMLRAALVRTPRGEELLEVPAPGTRAAEDVLVRVEADPAGGTAAAGDGLRARHEAQAAARLVPEAGRMVGAVWWDAGPSAPGQLLLVVHHLAVDGVSWRVIGDDLTQAWQAVARGERPRLDPVPVSFRRWARLLHRAATDPAREAEAGYWQRVGQAGDVDAEPAVTVPGGTADQVVTLDRTLPADLTAQLLGPVPEAFRTGPEEVLLSGLALAVTAWQAGRGHAAPGRVVVDLEGHGREESLGDLDLSRTVGWFTTLYPVALDVTGIDTDDALAGGPAAGTALKRVKEQLAQVPDRGIGHGLLRWLNPATAPALSTAPAPLIGFNYLGRFAATGAGEAVRDWAAVPGEPLVGGGVPDGTPVPHPLDIVAITEDGPEGPRLTAGFSWPAGRFTEPDVAVLAGLWERALAGLARHAARPGSGGTTPSDLTLGGLSQQEIDELEAEFAMAGEEEL